MQGKGTAAERSRPVPVKELAWSGVLDTATRKRVGGELLPHAVVKRSLPGPDTCYSAMRAESSAGIRGKQVGLGARPPALEMSENLPLMGQSGPVVDAYTLQTQTPVVWKGVV